MRLQGTRWLIGLFVVTGCLTGCGGGDQPGGTAANNELSIPTVFKQNCVSCHGNQLQGRVGPNLQKVGSRLTEEELVQLIHAGKGGMPAYGKRLREEEIASIAAWLAEQK